MRESREQQRNRASPALELATESLPRRRGPRASGEEVAKFVLNSFCRMHIEAFILNSSEIERLCTNLGLAASRAPPALKSTLQELAA